MKKLVALLAVLSAVTFTSCGSKSAESTEQVVETQVAEEVAPADSTVTEVAPADSTATEVAPADSAAVEAVPAE